MIRSGRFVLWRRNFFAVASSFAVAAVFAEEPTPSPDDVAYTEVASQKTYYRSIDALFSEVTNDVKVVVMKDCAFSGSVIVTNNVQFCSERTEGCRIDLSRDARFEIAADSSLSVSNLFICRYKSGSAPFRVNGGALRFESGAVVSNLRMSAEGNAIRIDSGVFTMGEGSAIRDCETASGCVALGGAVYLAGTESRFEFFGGVISGCSSLNSGGAVYAAKGATVALKGDATATGNFAGRAPDVYFAETADGSDAPLLSVEGELTGNVGVYYSGRVSLSSSFATVDVSVDPAAVCPKISNSADGTLCAAPSADGKTLVWAAVPAVNDSVKPLPDSNGAEARVVNGSSVRYYAEAADAMKAAAGGERVELLKNASLSGFAEIRGGVVLDGCGFTLSRDGEYFIDVGGSDLSVTNIIIDGADSPGRFLNVKGGSLVIECGTTIRNVNGSAADFVAPIVVWGGTFTMNGGRIENCVNGYVPGPGGPLTAGAVAISGATAYLNGGVITGCVGSRAGGFCAYNMSTAYVRGGFTVLNNSNPAGAVCNLVIQDLSRMTVVGDVTGKVGCYDGYMADTNIATYVDAAYASSATPSNLVASAFRFRHDVQNVKAVPVTDGVETLFVWRTALRGDGKFVRDAEGAEKVYDQIEFPVADEDHVACPPFSFTSVEKSVAGAGWILKIKPAKEHCRYCLYASDDLKQWEKVHETGVLAPGSVTADGEYFFETPASGDRRFWRAEGRDGLK